jgi:ankyrin repeat protein
MKKIIVMIIVLGGQLAFGMWQEEDLKEHFGFAASHGGLKRVKELLDQGANVNWVYSDGTTVLMQASQQGNLDTVRFLLDRGANINAVANNRWTALMFACQQGNVEVVRLLLDRGAAVNSIDAYANNALKIAVGQGHIEVVRFLLDRGANINEADRYGETLLMRSALAGNLGMVRFLLDRGADIDINVSDVMGLTALMKAAGFRGHFETVLELLTFIPVTEHKAIQENVRNLRIALKRKAAPKDVRVLIGQDVINQLVQEEMPHIMARARLLAATRNAISGRSARDMALARSTGNERGNFQAIADLLDLDSPASQATLRGQVKENIRRIVANPLPEQPQPWYQRAWSSVKQTAQNYWKWIAGGTAVTVGGYMAWKKMQKN